MELPLRLIVIPLVAAAITQALKVVIGMLRSGRVEWTRLTHYGGMPSGHTAYVTALVTVIGAAAGVTSIAFAIALAFAVVTVRDAVSFRQYLSTYGAAINHMLREHPKGETAPPPEHIEERLGHTPRQAVVGGILGVSLGWLLWRLFSG